MRLFISILIVLSSFYANAKTKSSNPDISLNGLFTYRTSNLGNTPGGEATSGFAIQEVELRVTSNIDSNFRGDFTLALEEEGGEFAIEPEEAFVETLSLPSLTIRAGKFFAYWGRHNQLHSHSFPFIDAPLSREALLGEEGLSEIGVAASYLTPLPWYSEVIGQVFSGGNESVFASPSQDDIAAVLYLKNLWDLNDDSTIEVDLGVGSGHDINSQRNHIYNATLFYKWRPNSANSFSWTTEYSLAEKVFDENGAGQGRVAGLSSWVQYQFSKSYWLQARTEVVDFVDSTADSTKKHSALVGWVPSEFSSLRLQYDDIDESGAAEKEQRVTLQLNVSMGAHPAHGY